MNEINASLSQYPLSVDTLGDMQADYKHVATAVATMRNSSGRRRNFILSGCEQIGDSGYIVYNNVLYNVVANNNTTANTLEIVVTEKTDTIDGQMVVISTEKHIEWTEGGSILYDELFRASLNCHRMDSEFQPLTIASDSGIKINTPIMCGLQGGDLIISGSWTTLRYIDSVTLSLPSIYIPIVDVIIPVKVRDEYTMAVVDSSVGTIKVLLPSDSSVDGVNITINAAIDGRYL